MLGSKMKATVLIAVFNQFLFTNAEPPVNSYLPARARTSEEENGYQYPATNLEFAKKLSAKYGVPQGTSRSFSNPNPTAKTITASKEYGVPEARNPTSYNPKTLKTYSVPENNEESVDAYSENSRTSYEMGSDYKPKSSNYVDSDSQSQSYSASQSKKAGYNYQRDIIRTYGIPKSMLNFNYDTISSDYLPPDEDNVSVYSSQSYDTPPSNEFRRNEVEQNTNLRSQSYDGESLDLETNDEISPDYSSSEARSSGYNPTRSKSISTETSNAKSSFVLQNPPPTLQKGKPMLSKSANKKALAKTLTAKAFTNSPRPQYGTPNGRSDYIGEYGLPKDVSPLYGEPDVNTASFESADRTVSSAFALPEIVEARQFSPSHTSATARNGITQAILGSSASTARPKPKKVSASNTGFKSLLQFRHTDATPSPFRSSSEQYGVPSSRISPTYLPADEDREGYFRNSPADAVTEAANYKFEYAVSDYDSESDFGHAETRQYDKTQGMYHVLLPDGRKQIVEYEADEKGFKPRISYEDPDPSFSAKSGYPKGLSKMAGYNANAQSLARSQESKEDTSELNSDESGYPDSRSGPY